MKICVIGDQHFRHQLPYSGAVSDGRRAEWDAVIATIHEASQQCDAVVLLGDNLNSKHNHSAVIDEFVQFLCGFGEKPVYVISGNHERFGKDTAIDFLKGIKNNWHVFTDPASVTLGDLSMMFLPYMTPGSLEVENLEQAAHKIMDSLAPADLLFHHHAVTGTEISGTTSEHLNEVVLPREELEKRYRFIHGGHIHQSQQLSDKTYVTGNIFTHEVGEHDKSIHILDTTAQTSTLVPLPVRGIYAVTYKGDAHSMVHIPDHSIVKCVITDRGTDLDQVKDDLARFDASVIVEQYPRERSKVQLDDVNGLDLSIDALLKVYCEAKDVPYDELKTALELIES